MGISKAKVIASNSQPGPTESGSGKAQYTPAAASIATNAGHRGSRMVGLRMTVWRNTRVKSNTVFVAPQKDGARLAPRIGPEMFRPGEIGRGALWRKKDAGALEQGKSPAALEGLLDGIFGVSAMDKHSGPRDCGGRGAPSGDRGNRLVCLSCPS